MEAFIGIYLGELVFRLDFRLEQRVEHQARAAGRAESGQVLVCKPWSEPPGPLPSFLSQSSKIDMSERSET